MKQSFEFWNSNKNKNNFTIHTSHCSPLSPTKLIPLITLTPKENCIEESQNLHNSEVTKALHNTISPISVVMRELHHLSMT